jgi:hypothetical protein
VDDRRFDSLAKSLSAGKSRRSVLKGLLGLGGTAVVSGTLVERETEAARRPTPTSTPVKCPGNQIPPSMGSAPAQGPRHTNVVLPAALARQAVLPALPIPNAATTPVAMAAVTGKSSVARPIRERASNRQRTRSAGLPREWSAAPPISAAVRSTGAAIRSAGVAKTASPIAAHRAPSVRAMARQMPAAPTTSSVVAPAPAAIFAAIQTSRMVAARRTTAHRGKFVRATSA